MKSVTPYISLVLALLLVFLESIMAVSVSDRIINVIFILWLFSILFVPNIFNEVLSSRRYMYLYLFAIIIFLLVMITQGPYASFIRVYKLFLMLSPLLMYDVYKRISRGASLLVIICFVLLFIYNSSIIIHFSNMTDGLGMRKIREEYEIHNSIASSISLTLMTPVISHFIFNPFPEYFPQKRILALFVKGILVIALLLVLYVVYRAAFITELFIGILGIIWGACYGKKRWKRKVVVYSVIPFVLFVGYYSLIMQRVESIDNSFVLQEKMDEVYYTLTGQASQAADYGARSNRFTMSLNTFFSHPMTGVVIESKGFEDQYDLGVGNHSEWVDCLALYGLPALLLLAFVFGTLRKIGDDLNYYLFILPYLIIGVLNPILFLPQNATTFFFIPILIRYFYKK